MDQDVRLATVSYNTVLPSYSFETAVQTQTRQQNIVTRALDYKLNTFHCLLVKAGSTRDNGRKIIDN